ncbi:DinB family protein [Granulicella sp. dw_53]|uniref:DinB family protein n=1 Tax=Granulicella sp. dw_53 TaxID=2719792 RepID=UPI001BD43400|nr:DinB family protein [Granulicella sp. dw_53]
MKILIHLTLIGLSLSPVLHAQSVANPVVSSAREIYDRQSKFITAAAEQMPADKYGYHPTPGQWTYGKIVAHVLQANNAVCAMLADTPAPTGPKVSETDSKEVLVTALKSSFTFCDKALTNLQDAKLGDTITYFRNTHPPRARALFELTDDLEDHYSQMASYLRLNDMVPPSAAPKK